MIFENLASSLTHLANVTNVASVLAKPIIFTAVSFGV